MLLWIKFKYNNFFCKYALITPFLACTLYARRVHFFQNHNYQGGTGNFTYKASILAGQQKALQLPPELSSSQIAICILLKPPSHSIQLQLVTQLVSQLAICCTTRITSFAIRDQPIILFLSIMLCCSALKIHLLCSRTRIFVGLLCFYVWQFTTCSRLFYQSVLMKVPICSIIR